MRLNALVIVSPHNRATPVISRRVSCFLSRYRFRYRRAEFLPEKEDETRHVSMCVSIHTVTNAARSSCTFITIIVALLPNGYALPS